MEIDFNARYTAPDFRGVALAPIRYATKSVPITCLVTLCAECSQQVDPDNESPTGWVHWGSGEVNCTEPLRDVQYQATPGNEVEDETGEFDEVEDREWIICIMVGDDTEQLIETDTLVKIDDDDYCHECGQLGCGHDGRDRS